MAAGERYQPAPAVATAKELARRWWGAEVYALEASGASPDLDPSPSPERAANAACRLALASKDGARRCAASIARAHEKARARPGEPIAHECHLGFSLVAAASPSGAGLVACGLRDRPAEGDELERVRDRLLELRVAGAEALAPIPGCSGVERARVADLVRLAATSTASEPEPRDAGKARGARPARRSADQLPPIIGHSLAILDVQKLIERVAASDTTVLVHGESGTGKELVARQVHERGARRDRPFVAQNCSALNDNLLESALFGHVRGAFTGATRDTRGLFELADGGTLFLDEIGDMSPALQVKLLRVLQEGAFTPVGGSEERRADVRVIAATHKDLGELVRRRAFREDLYYRINVIRLVVPPLRERDDDLLVLVDHFLRRFARGPATPRLSTDAVALFRRYPWPGNVRELQNEIERLCVLAGDEDVLGAELVSPRIAAHRGPAAQPVAESLPSAPGAARRFPGERLPRLRDAVEELERALLEEALRRHAGNRSRVARELGIARSNLVLKLARYGLA